MNPRVIGLDPALSRTGLALPEGTTVSIVSKVEWHQGDDGNVRVRRCADIATKVAVHLRRAMPIDVAVVEGYLPGAIGGEHTLIRLVEVGALIRFVLDQMRIPFLEVHPSTLKSLAAGSAGADKPEMIRAAKWHGGDPANHDEADAFLLRWLGVVHYSEDFTGMTGHEAERLNKLAWPKIEGASA